MLNHLNTFVGSVEKWIAQRLGQRDREAQARQRQLDAERERLATLDVQREHRIAEIAEHGITSSIAFEVIERIDQRRQAQAYRIEQGEAMLSESSGSPDVDAALDFYDRIADVVSGRIREAPGIEELNAALASVLAGLWCELDPDRTYQRLLVQFALRAPTQEHERRWLPPVGTDYAPIEPLGWSETEHITTVIFGRVMTVSVWAVPVPEPITGALRARARAGRVQPLVGARRVPGAVAAGAARKPHVELGGRRLAGGGVALPADRRAQLVDLVVETGAADASGRQATSRRPPAGSTVRRMDRSASLVWDGRRRVR